MTVINGSSLFEAAPIKDMAQEKIIYNGVSYGLSEAGYDIRIKQAIRIQCHDDKWYWTHKWDAPIGKLGEWGEGKFCLASAIEEFQMPNNLVGIVHDKSTWARQGLSVFNTVIEPGWNGFLTLELVYHGQKDLHIPAGSGIAQVIFHEVAEASTYNGKYQNQKDKPVDSIFQNRSEIQHYQPDPKKRGFTPK